LLHQSANSLLFTEPEGHLPCSEELSTCSYHHPNQSRPQVSPYFSHTNFHITLPCTFTSPTWALPFMCSNYNFVNMSYYSHACYMTHLFYLPSSYYVNNVLDSTNHEAPHYSNSLHNPVTFCLLGQRVCSAPCIKTSGYFLSLKGEIQFHTHTKQHKELKFYLLKPYIF
jgi:hypothetical protein